MNIPSLNSEFKFNLNLYESLYTIATSLTIKYILD
jgi:hypothetical protein